MNGFLSGWIDDFIASFWWVSWVFYGLLAVMALIGLAKLKELGGWPAVFAVLTLGAYGVGHWRGRKGEPFNPIEQVPEDAPDADPPVRKPKMPVRRTAKRTLPPESLSK